MQVVGFYGNIETCKILASKYLGKVVEFDRRAEGMVAIKNNDKIALIYYADEHIYNFKNLADSNHLAVTYIRYLIDICETIFIAPSETFAFNQDLTNPYTETCNPYFILNEVVIKPDDKVNIKKIDQVNDKMKGIDFHKHQCFSDFSKFIIKADMRQEILYEEIKRDVNVNDLIKPRNVYSSYASYKKYDYKQLESIILEKWPHDLFYFYEDYNPKKFEKVVKSIFEDFIIPVKIGDFREIVEMLQERYTK